MKLKPLHDWVVIRRHEAGEMTEGGIIIPESAKDIPSEGTILAIGPGNYVPVKGNEHRLKFVPTSLKPGQKVFYKRYAEQEVQVDGEEFMLVREEDILGTFEGHGHLTVKENYSIQAKPESQVMAASKKETPLMAISPKQRDKKPAKAPEKKGGVKSEKKVKQSQKVAPKKTERTATSGKKTAAKAVKTTKKTTSLKPRTKAVPKPAGKKTAGEKKSQKRTAREKPAATGRKKDSTKPTRPSAKKPTVKARVKAVSKKTVKTTRKTKAGKRR